MHSPDCTHRLAHASVFLCCLISSTYITHPIASGRTEALTQEASVQAASFGLTMQGIRKNFTSLLPSQELGRTFTQMDHDLSITEPHCFLEFHTKKYLAGNI
jgi:hypothetical protein